MTAIAGARGAAAGLRPMDVRRDLSAIAHLVEVCFGDQLDRGGRSAVREKHALSRYGPLLGLLEGVLQHTPGWYQGFVWEEHGRVVGNVGLQPSPADRATWIIANVAVHPDSRRRGIARQLVHAAIDLACERGGREAILQVDDGNDGAKQLYYELGFETLSVRTHWERRSRQTPDQPEGELPPVRLANREDWRAACRLLRTERPAGLAWTQPLDANQVRPSLSRTLSNFLNGKREERWVVGGPDELEGWMRLRVNLGRTDEFVLAAQGDRREEVERALLVCGLRRLGRRPWPVRAEHPTGESVGLLQDFQFRPVRSLCWMRLAL